MKKSITLGGRITEYELIRKNVKYINLRIKPGGGIYVSASRYVPEARIEKFITERAEFILKALSEFEELQENIPVPKPEEYEDRERLLRFCEKMDGICRAIYPYFAEKGISFPHISYRYMSSRWGSCRPQKCRLTFNLYLAFVPESCARYVACHEFAHFLHPDHSKEFYSRLALLCPEWKEQKALLRKYERVLLR